MTKTFHPHSHLGILAAIGAHWETWAKPIPSREFDSLVWLDPEDNYVGNGRTLEAAAIDALDNPRVWARFGIWGEHE